MTGVRSRTWDYMGDGDRTRETKRTKKEIGILCVGRLSGKYRDKCHFVIFKGCPISYTPAHV
jgi:hypothetical protein